jgi:hypothetical protein
VKRLLLLAKIILLTTTAFMFISGVSLRGQAYSDVFQLIQAPVEPMSTVTKLTLPMLPVVHLVTMPLIPVRPLFEEAKVSAEVSKLASPETFREVKVFTQMAVLANFTEVTVNLTTG